MSTAPDCFADASPVAADVARGVARLLFRQGACAICEVPLPNGRRADMMAVDGAGSLIIVEIKVSRADLLGDRKWPDYLDYCDRFFWAVPPGLSLDPFDGPTHGADRSGLIVADRYDAAIVRDAPCRPLAPARRKAETLRFARRAAQRLLGAIDPALSDGS